MIKKLSLQVSVCHLKKNKLAKMKTNSMYSKLLLCAMCLLLASCSYAEKGVKASSNYILKEVTEVAPFTEILVFGSPDVEYTQSADGTTKVSVYGSDNLIDVLEATVQNGALHVKNKSNTTIIGNSRLKVIASSPELHRAEVQGSGEVYMIGTVQGSDLQLKVKGSGDIEGDVVQYTSLNLAVQGSGDIDLKRAVCDRIAVNIDGSGDVSLKGQAREAEFLVFGSGDIAARRMVTEDLTARVRGSGDITCYATRRLKASVDGSGDIGYGGSPQEIFLEGKRSQVKKLRGK